MDLLQVRNPFTDFIYLFIYLRKLQKDPEATDTARLHEKINLTNQNYPCKYNKQRNEYKKKTTKMRIPLTLSYAVYTCEVNKLNTF